MFLNPIRTGVRSPKLHAMIDSNLKKLPQIAVGRPVSTSSPLSVESVAMSCSLNTIEYVVGGHSMLLRKRVVCLDRMVTPISALGVVSQLQYLERKDPLKPITLLINSPGGNLYSALAICGYISTLTPPVKTHVVGIAYSAAATILTVGSERYATQNSRIMTHQVNLTLFDSPIMSLRNLISRAHSGSECNEHIVRVMLGNVPRSPGYLKDKMKDDAAISAEEALEAGYIQEIRNNVFQ